MSTLPSPKTIICRDCGYEHTIHINGESETAYHFCERCGSEHLDIEDNSEFIRHHPVQFLKDLLHTKIF